VRTTVAGVAVDMTMIDVTDVPANNDVVTSSAVTGRS
jgi:hypothetical protein